MVWENGEETKRDRNALILYTIIFVLQGVSGCKAHHMKFGPKVKQSTDKALLNMRCNFGGVITNERNMMDTCIRHKECAVVL